MEPRVGGVDVPPALNCHPERNRLSGVAEGSAVRSQWNDARAHEDMGESLQQIVERLWVAPDHAEWTQKTDVIPIEDLRHWTQSEDIEILGFAMAMIDDRRFQIEPPLTRNEYISFVLHYYGRCLKENPRGEWAGTSYSAGRDLVNIFGSLWRDQRVSRDILRDLRDWLATLFVEGDESLRKCLVTATLEHLFEQKEIRQFFADWKRHPVLAVAYEEASLWSLGGGKTPLGKPRTGME